MSLCNVCSFFFLIVPKIQLGLFCATHGLATISGSNPLPQSLILKHRWIIYPEGVTDRETFCDGSCSNADILTREWYGSIGVNAARTEYPNDKYPYHVLQHPGETIYVPDGIVHSVFNMDATIAVTRNYGSAANLDKVWQEVCTSGDDRKWKILYNLVLNKEQRRRVRNSKYYPFHQNCKEIDVKDSKGGEGRKVMDKPMDEMVEKLWHPSFNPKVGDTVEARYKGEHNEVCSLASNSTFELHLPYSFDFWYELTQRLHFPFPTYPNRAVVQGQDNKNRQERFVQCPIR